MRLAENSLGPTVSHVEQGAAEEAALNPDVPIPARSSVSPEKPVDKPLGVIEALDAVRNDSSFNRIYRFGRNVIHRWQLIPLKQYRVCAFIALVSLSIMWPTFWVGLAWGFYLSLIIFLYVCVSDPITPDNVGVDEYEDMIEKIRKECVEEDTHEDESIYKGWMNLFPTGQSYSPHTFHVNSLQTVLVRLDGHFLRISHPNRALLKHGFHTDPTLTEAEPRMIAQSIHDLTNATVKLRPRRLARRRWFSRKYPICIKLGSSNRDIQANRIDPHITDIQEVTVGDGKHEDDEEAYADYATIAEVEEVGREPDGYISDASSEGSDDEGPLKHSASDTGIVRTAERKLPTAGRRSGSRPPYDLPERWFHRLRRACYRFVLPQDVGSEFTNRRLSLPHHSLSAPQMSRDYFLYILHAMHHLDDVMARKAHGAGTDEEQQGVVLMNLGQNKWNEPVESSGRELVIVANLLAHRIFYDFCRDEFWIRAVQSKIQTKLATIHLPYFIDTLELSGFNIGTAIPRIERIYAPIVDEWGIWVDFELKYEGVIKLALETRVNLMRLKETTDSVDQTMETKDPATCTLKITPGHYSTSPDESYGEKVKMSDHGKEKKKTGQKILHLVEKVAQTKLFKEASELRPIRKIMEDISTTRLMLNVEVNSLEGTMTVNLPGPPSDRLWYAFRRPPKMSVHAVPQVGDRSVVFSTLSDWIENKIVNVLEKNLVLPNMDDIVIPVLSGNELLQGPLNR
ncbi:SMP-LTD domain-containing protein [Aphelenchoides fujianensis]|nr:SMP-LTD domain-containing protein [Aphelenchoides fujianensis]